MGDLSALRLQYRSDKAALMAHLGVQGTSTRGVRSALQKLSRLTDQTLRELWTRSGFGPTFSLIAVGGYGRGELFPYSDVDVLVLLPDGSEPDQDEALKSRLEGFIGACWDVGLEIGSSVRSTADCVAEASKDVTVQTSLLECRLICGGKSQFTTLVNQLNEAMDPKAFFVAKTLEMRQRHNKFEDTPYSLEPNCKESPGGLRDLQIVLWVAKAAGLGRSWDELARKGLATSLEARQIKANEALLNLIRARLHLLANRREDRLVFDLQNAVAESFGFKPQVPAVITSGGPGPHAAPVVRGARRASEVLMKRYYWAAKAVTQLNQILLLNIEERLASDDLGVDRMRPINERFFDKAGMLEVASDNLYVQHPHAILETFHIYQTTVGIKGLSARTLRALYNARPVMNAKFRNDPVNRATFMQILMEPEGITHAMRLMNQTSVLGRYLWVFRHIVGQMQHDLFHVYTVDEHTLFVLRNVRRYTHPEYRAEFPLCNELMEQIPKREVIYIAALFHDIAKGRGGDHSELGSEEVLTFCRRHQLSDYDSRLAVWLVRNHLLMSGTAQRQDISDPEVVNAFAAAVGDRIHLDYLYLLTLADIRATSPTLWNSWKGTLLNTLYNSTRYALRRGLTNPIDADELIAETKEEARKQVRDRAVSAEDIAAFWNRLDDDYFLRYTTDAIAWHTETIAAASAIDPPLILIRQQTQRGGTEVFIYTPRRDNLFALTTSTLDQMGLTITDARIMPSRDGYTLDTYIVLEEDGRPVSDAYRIQELETTLHEVLAHPDAPPQKVERRLPRQLKHFTIPTQVTFQPDPYNDRTVMEVVSSDRPGLLSQIGKAMMECDVRLQNAKIATLGARVEDIFFVTDAANRPLQDAAQMEHLRQRIVELLAT